MSEAREVGVDEAGTAAIERDIATAQARARAATDVLSGNALKRTRSVDPEYPQKAREAGASGFVDLLYTVRSDGTTGDITVVGAEPAGFFEDAAMTAVRKWRYDPVVRDGRAVDQRVRIRIRFNMEK